MDWPMTDCHTPTSTHPSGHIRTVSGGPYVSGPLQYSMGLLAKSQPLASFYNFTLANCLHVIPKKWLVLYTLQMTCLSKEQP